MLYFIQLDVFILQTGSNKKQEVPSVTTVLEPEDPCTETGSGLMLTYSIYVLAIVLGLQVALIP